MALPREGDRNFASRDCSPAPPLSWNGLVMASKSSSTAVSLLVELNVGVAGLFWPPLLFRDELLGEGGGGIATAEGIRAFGVASEGLPFPKLLGVPTPDNRGSAFGVVGAGLDVPP